VKNECPYAKAKRLAKKHRLKLETVRARIIAHPDWTDKQLTRKPNAPTLDGMSILGWVAWFEHRGFKVSYGTLWKDRVNMLAKGMTEQEIASRWITRHAP
jgi:hypothetical protein